ncbi:CPBP family intramembrane metalloprotease [candidate division KSB1 bacterium]|nr:CPBP family intramembrane metalloprotease [candidate division KSB1 bacterium]
MENTGLENETGGMPAQETGGKPGKGSGGRPVKGSGGRPGSPVEESTNELRIPTLFETFIVLFVTAGFIFFATIVFFVISVYYPLDTEFLLLEGVIIIPALVFAKIKGYSFRRIFRLNPISKQQLISAVVIGISLVVVINFMENMLQSLPQPGWYSDMKSQFETGIVDSLFFDSTYKLIVLIISIVIFAAFFEEMLFRGFIQQSFESRFSPVWAVVITAMMFSVLHPFGMLPIMMLAMVLGFMSLKSNSIYPAIVIHGLNNGISLFALNASEELRADPSMGIIFPAYIVMGAIAALYFGMKYYFKSINEEGETKDEIIGD